MGDLLQIIRNIAAIVPNLQTMFLVFSWVFGVIFVIMSLRLAAKRQAMGPNSGDWSQPLWMFFIGISFVAIPSFIFSFSQSIFGMDPNPDPSSIFAYAPSTLGVMADGGPAQEIIEGIVVIVRLIGLIAVMRGLIMLNQTAQGTGQGKTLGPGFTFVIAGIIALNFQVFVGVMDNLLTGAPSALDGSGQN